ncbi:hypothetical protein Q5H92_00085 [Hymenobacter sp. M29]|uniref:Uncharacterized protein n=1 Tax=Hymenobacter mellowenesis TaxID=3063995 RepID=A0ABT9A4G4_9BACT|nr:hypothetical protein [Hymenobacter sp. M29]MDO7844736.1 hypothetical protein [Hymenobacter sp. M29]
METPPNLPGPVRSATPPVALDERPNRPAWRAHWLALAIYAIYTGRWVQYIVEARAYHAQPAPGGAGDALNWLLLGQLGFALLFAAVLLANAIWRKPGRWFYVVMSGLVLLPFLLQYFIEG